MNTAKNIQLVNVVNMKDYKDVNDFVRVYDIFISMQTARTQEKYQRVIPEFFQMVCGKLMQEIKANDLDSISRVDVQEKYFKPLKDKGFKNSTLRNYASVVKSFLSELEKNEVFYDQAYTGYKKLREVALDTTRLKDDTENRKTMSEDGYEALHDWLVNGREWSERYVHKAEQYQLALEFMFNTAVRLNATFNHIKWKNIKFESDSQGNQSYVVYAKDKGGKINKKPISIDFYDKLKDVMYEGDDNALVFGTINKRSFSNYIKEFSEETGYEFTPHSIKNGAGTKLWNMTHDPIKVKDFLDHESLETTMRYIREQNNFLESGSYILSSSTNLASINDLEYNDIMEIISDNPDIAYQIISKAKQRGIING